MDQAVGSPDKLLWTTHSARELDTDEIIEEDRRAQLKKAMCERAVRGRWPVYAREHVIFGEKIGERGQAEIYAASLGPPDTDNMREHNAVVVKKFKTFNGIVRWR